MSHTLKVTNGSSILLSNLVGIPDTFKSPSEILRAAEFLKSLDAPAYKDDAKWLDEGERQILLPEKTRDLLKRVIEQHANKLAPSKYAIDILTQLGFEM